MVKNYLGPFVIIANKPTKFCIKNIYLKKVIEKKMA